MKAAMQHRGFMVYPGQHSHARRAAGCKTKAELLAEGVPTEAGAETTADAEARFATLCAKWMRSEYGANSVMPTVRPGYLEAVVAAYVAAWLYVLPYVQGDFYFDGERACKEGWTEATIDKLIDDFVAYTDAFRQYGDRIIGVCVTEEAEIWDRDRKSVV